MKNNKIIYKQNPVIRGYFLTNEENGNKLTLISEFDFDVLNAIYLTTQQNLFASHPIRYKELVKIEISLQDIQKLLLRKRKDYRDIKASIQNLFSTDIVLKDFMHPETGSKYKEYHTHIIHKYAYLKENNNICEMELDELFLINILRHTDKQSDKKIGNFTPIRLHNVESLRSKYAKRLYEYMLSIKTTKKEFSLHLDALNKLFGTNHKNIARLTQIVNRVHPQICTLLNFEYEHFKEDKLISFKLIAVDLHSAQHLNSKPKVDENYPGIDDFKKFQEFIRDQYIDNTIAIFDKTKVSVDVLGMLVKINDEFKHTAKWREQLDADKAIQVWQWLFTHQESIKGRMPND